MTIIDVSEWQGVIHWNKVKPQIDGAILRCGCGTSYNDKQWARNVAECERLGIPYGVYLYSYAKDVNAARAEAEHVLRMVKGHRLAFPIYFDAEQNGTERFAHTTAATFCPLIEAAGYRVGIYSTAAWFRNYIGLPQYTRWVASWGSNNGKPQIKPNVQNMGMWQYTSVGKFNGIKGNVDVSLCYLTTNTEDDDMTDEQVRKIVREELTGNGKAASEWAVGEVEAAKALGITDGSRPQGYAKREEVFALFNRYDEKHGAGAAVKEAVAAVIERIKGVL